MNLTSPTDPNRAASDSIPPAEPPPARLGWLVVVMLTATLTAVSTYQSLRRYEELRSGWSWDLAYYNQWFWALTQGDGTLSVRPVSAYAQEGPSIWKMNYLAPIRLAIVPFYAMFPDPRTLIVLQNVVFWWVIPAAYSLVRSESRSRGVALSAALLVPMTPLFWPLVWNDFRELQLVAPFILWAIQGVRSRSVRLAAVGIVGMLACRQEFAVIVMTFALLPPRRPESLDVTLRWRRATVLVGLCWVLFGFFGYLRLMVGRGAPDAFIDQFLGPKASISETLRTSAEALILGMGGWAVLMCLAPRVAILAVPWIWSLCSGRWAIRFLVDSGVAPRAIRHADGRDGPRRGPDRLRSTGRLAAAPARRASLAYDGLAGRCRDGRRRPPRRLPSDGRRPPYVRPPGSRGDCELDPPGRSPTMPCSPTTTSPPPSPRDGGSTATSWTPTSPTAFPGSAPNSTGCSSGATIRCSRSCWNRGSMSFTMDSTSRSPAAGRSTWRKKTIFSDFARTQSRDKMSRICTTGSLSCFRSRADRFRKRAIRDSRFPIE